jgi:hypothetical protein
MLVSCCGKGKLGTMYILACRTGVIQHNRRWRKYDDAGRHSISDNISKPFSFDVASDP